MLKTEINIYFTLFCSQNCQHENVRRIKTIKQEDHKKNNIGIQQVWAFEILEASKRSIMSFLYVSDIFD